MDELKKEYLGRVDSPYIFNNRAVRFPGIGPSRGVSKVIKHVFARTYKHAKITNRPKPNVGGLKLRQACSRGKSVDSGLTKFYTHGTRSRLVEVNTLIKVFESLGLECVETQSVVAWPEARLATQLDLLMFNKTTKRLVVVEVKCGSVARRCATATGTLLTMPQINDCLLHQHQLQTLLGRYLLAKTYPKVIENNVEMLLVYVQPDGSTEVFKNVDFTVRTMTDGIIAALLSTTDVRTTRKRRRTTKKSTKKKSTKKKKR